MRPFARRLPTFLIALPVALFAMAGAAAAQSINLDFGEGGSSTSKIIQLLALLTVLSLAPAILIMVTSFTRIVVVLSFLRNALGLQQTPPNAVLISLALFLTGFVMAPTLDAAYREGIAPLIANQITEEQAFERSVKPVHLFMMEHVREHDLQLFSDIAQSKPDEVGAQTPLRTLIPAFMISELRAAFIIGFVIFVPFLVIDLVVASALMSMGMMMLPPVMISLPFKILLFVLVDGWALILTALIGSYNVGGG
jgi:flagellar biosynthetic protein FliP